MCLFCEAGVRVMDVPSAGGTVDLSCQVRPSVTLSTTENSIVLLLLLDVRQIQSFFWPGISAFFAPHCFVR